MKDSFLPFYVMKVKLILYYDVYNNGRKCRNAVAQRLGNYEPLNFLSQSSLTDMLKT